MDNQPNPITAESLKVGDVLAGVEESKSGHIHKIVKITRHDGVYAPLTPSGTILVDGIHASTYVSLLEKGYMMGDEYPQLANGMNLPWSQHSLIHIWLAPYRIVCLGISSSLCNQFVVDGKPLWVDSGMKLVALAEENANSILQLILLAFFERRSV